MKGHKRLISILLVLGMVAALLPVAAVAAAGDTVITNIATQAQAAAAGTGYISTMTKTACATLQYGQVFYYPLRTGASDNITAANALTPADYTLAYTPGASESFNAVKSLEMVYAPTSATVSRWWMKVTLIDQPVGAPATLPLDGVFSVAATTPSINVTMAPKDYNYPLTVVAVAGTKKVATTISTVPQYAQGGATYISNDTSGASTARNLDYGTVVYYLLRTASGSAGNIKAPDYLDPNDYTLAVSGAQGIKSGGLSIVPQQCVSGETFWYLKVEFIEQGSLTTDTPVKGIVTVTPSGQTAFTLNIGSSNDITLKAATATPVDKPIYSLATQAQAKGSNGVISVLNATQCQNLNYGDVIYYALRSTSSTSSYLTGANDLTPAKYTLGYTKSADEPFNAVKSVKLVYDNTDTASRWWIEITLIDKPAGAPAKLDLNGAFIVTAADPATNVSMAPKDGNFKLAVVGAVASLEKIVTTTSTAPQYIKEGDTLIAQNGTGTTSSRFPYGQTVYFILRDASGDIITPNYIVPSDYIVSNTSAQVVSTELVKGNYSGGERWYAKMVFINQPAGAAETAVTGTLTLTHKDGAVTTLDLTARGIKLGEAVASEKIVGSTSTAPQYIKEGDTLIAQNGTSSTSSRFPYGQSVYFILRDKDGKDIITPDYITPEDYDIYYESEQVVSAELVKGQYSGGERWYVKLVFIDQPTDAGDTTVEGDLTLTHKGGTVTALSLTARNITLSSDATPRPFDRIATWAQRMTDGAVRSISGASTSAPTVSYGERIYYALANGSSTTLSSASLLDPLDYEVTYTPTSSNNFDPFDSLELVYEPYATSSASGSKWFLMLQISDDAQGLMMADGLIEVKRIADGAVIASLDLAKNVPLILGGEDDTVNNKGVRTVTLVHHIGSTKLVESETGYVGRATSDLGGISSNVTYGETAYYMLFGQDKLGSQHPVSDPDAVEHIKIKNKLEQNADKIEKIEIIKKRSMAYGYTGYYYFLAITFVEQPTWVSRYTVMGDIVLEGKGKYGINTPDNTCKLFIDTVVGPERAHTRVDTQDEQEQRTLSDTYRRFSFKDDALGSDKEDELYFYGMSDDNSFVVDTSDQEDILLGNTVEYNEAVGARYPGADLFFFNGNTKAFNHHGVMTFSFSPDTFIYERNGSELSRINGLKYDEDDKAFKFLTKKIGSYVFSDTELDYDRYNIHHIATWAQSPNADGSLSSISGASDKGPTLEYGSTVYYALRSAEDKGITNLMAIEPENFTFGFVTNDPNAPVVKTAGLTYRTNWIKSSDSRSDKWYVTITFAEVPDPGVARKVSGDFVIYYRGEEVTRLTLGPTEAGNFTLTLHGGRPVENDWIPRDYIAPVLREEGEIEQAVVTSYLDAEGESDGEQASTTSDNTGAETPERDTSATEGSEPDGE